MHVVIASYEMSMWGLLPSSYDVSTGIFLSNSFLSSTFTLSKLTVHYTIPIMTLLIKIEKLKLFYVSHT